MMMMMAIVLKKALEHFNASFILHSSTGTDNKSITWRNQSDNDFK
jgi:hypothetical protein